MGGGRPEAAEGDDPRRSGARLVVALKAVVFDVGETLIDETRLWERAADTAGVPRFTLMGVVGGLAARGEHHRRAWELLGVDQPAATWGSDDFYPDALPCLAALRSGECASAPSATRSRMPRICCASTSTWSARRPAGASRSRRLRSSSGSSPSAASTPRRSRTSAIASTTTSRRRSPRGCVAVHVRRGPWGHLHEPPPAALAIDSLDELPEALGV